MSRAAALAALDASLLTQSSLRNKLINGNFDIWQRGTSFSGAGYCADRWKIDSSNNISVAKGAGTYPYGKYQLYISALAETNSLFIGQSLEDYNAIPLAGGKATLSFMAGASGLQGLTAVIQKSATPNVSLGGDGGWTTIASISVVVPKQSAQRFSLTADIPGDGSAAGLRVAFILNNVANAANIGIWGVQFEAGAVATPFESRPVQIELALCQRYFEKSYNVDVVPGTAGAQGAHVSKIMDSGSVVSPTVYYKVHKRNAPTLTYYSLVNGAAGRTTCSGVDVAGPSGSSYASGCSAFELYWSGNSLPTDQRNVYQHWTSDAEF